jgi:hypothetical protein
LVFFKLHACGTVNKKLTCYVDKKCRRWLGENSFKSVSNPFR